MAEDIIDEKLKFNIGIDAQKIIADILKKIYRVSVEYSSYSELPGAYYTAGNAQHVKYRLLITLNQAATPIYPKDEFSDNMDKKIKEIKLKTHRMYDRVGKRMHEVEVYDPDINDKMDELVREILIELRPVFKPMEDDEGL